MKLKRELENREKKPIHELNFGDTFIYQGMLHLVIGATPNNEKLQEILNNNYCLAVNLQENLLRQIQLAVEVIPVRAEILAE